MVQNYYLEKNRKDCERNGFPENNNDSLFCPFYFDGILCWKKTKSNSLAYQICPSYVVGFRNNTNKYATILCTSNATWERKKGQPNKAYTNYVDCISEDDENEALLVIILNIFYYIIY